MSNKQIIERPWHREPFVWLVIAIPASAVVMGVVMTWLAVGSNDGLVVDDYYKHGLEINRVLAREKAAESLGLEMDVILDPGQDGIRLDFAAAAGFSFPANLQGLLAHATREGLDQRLVFTRIGPRRFYSAVDTLPGGRWYLEVGTESWRLNKKIVTN